LRITKNSSLATDNLRKTESSALTTLKDDTKLTVLPADKRNATVVPNTSDYKQKISSVLEDTENRKLARDPRDAIQRNSHYYTTNPRQPKRQAGNCVHVSPKSQEYNVCPRYIKKSLH